VAAVQEAAERLKPTVMIRLQLAAIIMLSMLGA
jgi:hypothetical protein